MTGWEAALYLENGTLYEGEGFGAEIESGGEAVFNTGMTGYQEIFTDPSYYKQIVVMTYPHIGNTGVNLEDTESGSLYLSGVVCREYCAEPSNWRSIMPLHQYFNQNKIAGISGIETRELTQMLRDEGAQRSIIFPKKNAGSKDLKEYGKSLLQNVEDMNGLELVSRVSTKEAYVFGKSDQNAKNGNIVVYDYGVKSNIPRHFAKSGHKVWIVPFNMPYQEVLQFKPEAVVLSNGPGDPATVPDATEQIQGLIGKLPIMAVCMGHQLLARALGCTTYKLKFGHHGVNHPVKDIASGKVLITSQNHGFSVKAEDLKSKDITISHVSLNDGTVEGYASEKMRFSSAQFHPEAKPGPSDAELLFDSFIKGFLR